MEKTYTGLLVKHRINNKPQFVRWDSAGLREASYDNEGFYLKVDGNNPESDFDEQLYLYLNEMDVAEVLTGWFKAMKENGSEYGRWLIDEFTIFVRNDDG